MVQEVPGYGSTPIVQSRRRFLTRLASFALICFLAYQFYYMALGTNFYVVESGQVYRSAQLDARTLESIVQRYGIKTVVNLRGCCHPMDWYDRQVAVVQRQGISQEDLIFSAIRLPNATELRELIEVLERSERPLLLHCRQGVDRTGLASALTVLLKENSELTVAARQLNLRYGHLNFGRTAAMDQFLELYGHWLEAHGHTHTPERFKHWALVEYQGGPLRGVVERCEPLQAEIRKGQPSLFRVVVRNTGTEAWHLKPLAAAGLHLSAQVSGSGLQPMIDAKAAMLQKTIAPGEILETTLVLPKLGEAGTYRLRVDMLEADGTAFHQRTGKKAWEQEIVVRD